MREIINAMQNSNADYAKNNLPSIELVNNAEEAVEVNFGQQLKEYLLRYGYIGFESAQFYGINSIQKLNSNLITQTKYLNKYFEETIGYIAFENYLDGEYRLVDSFDMVYRYFVGDEKPEPLNVNLFEYINLRIKEENLIAML